MWQKFRALPPYLGGKRRLVKDILQHAQGRIFADAFMGAGSVSLFAKARGMQVHSNDFSYRSWVVGKALIENSTLKIEDQDLQRLLRQPAQSYIAAKYTPNVFTRRQAEFLDGAFEHTRSEENETRRALLQLLLIRHIFSTRSFNKFSHTRDTQDLEARKFDNVLQTAARAQSNLRMLYHPLTTLRRRMVEINSAVFPNGTDCTISRMDAVKFIAGVKADTAYFDPPYADTSTYENEYAVLDDILEGETPATGPNPWSNSGTARQEFVRLFEAAEHIPRWIISMGQTRSDSGISAEELAGIVGRYRKCSIYAFDHRWTVSHAGGEPAEKVNTEYIIVTI